MPPTPSPTLPADRPGSGLWLAAGTLLLAVLLPYSNSFAGPFVFDDLPSIPQNPTLDHFGSALSPPRGEGITVQGRPVLNLSFALNRALGGNAVFGYHLVNLLIHSCAALLLLGLVRRLLRRWGSGATVALIGGLASALLWAVHPLQTEAVTYLVQRAESLMGLWFLLCLYAHLRWVDSGKAASRSAWFWISFLACLLGMGTKEVMVSAPLVLWLFDGVFLDDGLLETLRRRGRVLACYALAWIPLILLVVRSGNRGGTSGFDVGVGAATYWSTEAVAVFTYFRLLVFPRLVFDYGTPWVTHYGEIAVAAAALSLALAVATAGVFSRGRRLRLFGPACFCVLFSAAILATTSVVPGNRQALAEHRMYLPSAAWVSLAACFLLRRVTARSLAGGFWAWLAGAAACALVLGERTYARNEDYRSALRLYGDTVAKAPDNAFARYNYAKALDEAGQPAAAVPQYEASARLAPERADIRYNLANDEAVLGNTREAEGQYREALNLKPDYALAHYNFGNLLRGEGRNSEAVAQYRAALAKYPDYLEARANLGGLLLEMGQTQEAESQLAWAVAHAPDDVESHYNLGMAFFLEGKRDQAIGEMEQVLRLRPGFPAAAQRLSELTQGR